TRFMRIQDTCMIAGDGCDAACTADFMLKSCSSAATIRLMTDPIHVLGMVKLSPLHVAGLLSAGYQPHQAADYPSRMDAVTDGGAKIRAVITNGRGGLSADEMEKLPNLEIICAVGAGYESID